MKNIFHSSDYDEIVSRIQTLSPDSKRLWGKMNVNEMICHITDQLRIGLSQKKAEFPFNPIVQFFSKRTFVYGFRFPRNFVTIREIKQSPGGNGTRPSDFSKDFDSLIKVLNEFVSKEESYPFASHPAFGKLNRNEWGLLAYKHLDHHLRQFSL